MSSRNISLTEADLETLCLCPDGWFDAHDLPPGVKRCRYRCDRLLALGMVESRVVGKFPILTTEYLLTGRAKEWLSTSEAAQKTKNLSVTFGLCKNWRVRVKITQK
jgi:hypothetical protein